jgi:hypothetical protein
MWLNHTWFATKSASKPDEVARGERKGFVAPYPFACFGTPLPTSRVGLAVWGASLISVSREVSLSFFHAFGTCAFFVTPLKVQVPSLFGLASIGLVFPFPLRAVGHLLSRLGSYGHRCPALTAIPHARGPACRLGLGPLAGTAPSPKAQPIPPLPRPGPLPRAMAKVLHPLPQLGGRAKGGRGEGCRLELPTSAGRGSGRPLS